MDVSSLKRAWNLKNIGTSMCFQQKQTYCSRRRLDIYWDGFSECPSHNWPYVKLVCLTSLKSAFLEIAPNDFQNPWTT